MLLGFKALDIKWQESKGDPAESFHLDCRTKGLLCQTLVDSRCSCLQSPIPTCLVTRLSPLPSNGKERLQAGRKPNAWRVPSALSFSATLPLLSPNSILSIALPTTFFFVHKSRSVVASYPSNPPLLIFQFLTSRSATKILFVFQDVHEFRSALAGHHSDSFLLFFSSLPPSQRQQFGNMDTAGRGQRLKSEPMIKKEPGVFIKSEFGPSLASLPMAPAPVAKKEASNDEKKSVWRPIQSLSARRVGNSLLV